MRYFASLMLTLALCCRADEVRRGTPFSTGYNQVGGVHLWGPNGIEAIGAYHMQDICTPTPQPGLRQCYQFKLVVDKPIFGYGLAPDILMTEAVSVWGDPAGHFWWQCGDWKIEMIAIEETVRQQVSWEAEKMDWRHADSGVQLIEITIGRDTLVITGKKPQP
ncbi:MAG TPA: hypothetical protein VNV86_13720 [Candidatus Acidoferrum sp.]|jgi:hypothetical protein|nr:hypothetical protein [Candidatus Acidoferrum sp.]